MIRAKTLLLLFLAAASSQAQTAGRPLLVTVDDLPISSSRLHPDPAERERITRGMLDVLRKHKIQALAFVTWDRVLTPADKDLLRLWMEAGHELGNHTFKHLNYTRTAPKEYIADAESARKEIAALSGKKVRFFRFPFLREGDTEAKLDAMRAYLAESGQRNVPVTLDDQDWSFEEPWVEARRKGDEAAMARIAEEYHESLHLDIRHHEETGDELFGRPVPQVILLHGLEVSAAQWDRLFTWLTQRGYRFATADEVLSDPALSEPHRYVGTYGPGLWDRLVEQKATAKALEDVRKLIETQVAAWNRGDLEAFTSAYAEDAAFLSPTGLTRGRNDVLERYRKRYPDGKAMGTLRLEPIEMRPAVGTEFTLVGGAKPSRVHGVSVAARWELSYPDKEPATGLTLIVFRRGREGWEIVQDASM
ncbi:MAG TPA: polysaccharide deacetylase family protein [Thermoanaerobaculia bacterium]|nr:polysaccharide deacetylase family protein [Thermoanaerobaculia bacterium]